MSATGLNVQPRSTVGSLADEVVSVVVGAAITAGLFFTMAHFEDTGGAPLPTVIEDLRLVSLPLDAPPPKIVEQPEAVEIAAPLAGLEISASESPVKLAIVPPDLDAIIPTTKHAPAATIQFNQLQTDFEPKLDVTADFKRVFQSSEVDRVPSAIVRTTPRVPPPVRRGAEKLRVILMMVINAKGAVESVRVLQSSNNPEFDAIVTRCVKEEWSFSPAIKKGQKVKCLTQQAVTINFTSGSRFEL
jgi:TonB family protein